MILRELAARYDLKFNERGFKKADKSIGGAMDKLKQLGALLATGVVARGVVKFVNDIRNIGDEIDKTSIALGVSRQALQEWRFAAGLGGVQTQELNVAMRTLQKAALDAGEGAAEYKDEFDRLGITVLDSAGKLKSADILLMEMADGLQTLETDTEKVATASNLLGRSGARLLPLFKDGSAGIKAMREEAQELGGVLGDDLVDASVELTDDIWRFQFAMLGIKASIARALLPIFNRIVLAATKVSRKFQEFTQNTGAVKHALELLGIVAIAVGIKLLVAFAAPIATVLLLAAAIFAVYLIFDEVRTLFEGGITLIGRFIDAHAGLGTAQEYVENYRTGVQIMGEAWDSFFKGFGTDMDAAGNALGDFGADLAGWVDTSVKAISEFIEWVSKLKSLLGIFGIGGTPGVPADLGAALDAAKRLQEQTEGREKTKKQKEREARLPGGAGEELRRRQTQRAKGRGIGTGVFRGPQLGETLPAGAQVPGGSGPPIIKRSAPKAPRIAPRSVQATARAGTSVNQKTNIEINVKGATGGARETANEIEKRLNKALKKRDRATMQAVKQHVGA